MIAMGCRCGLEPRWSGFVESIVESSHRVDVLNGTRFEFGENWRRFLSQMDESRVEQAKQSLRKMLGVEDFAGKRFLDVGAGSGLFSLAAKRMGAQVHSFDFDPTSVACVREIRRRFAPQADQWTIEEGSILDHEYLSSLGLFDIVYAWGVLHHTGQMWQSMENTDRLVTPGGTVFLAIYNDTGSQSERWKVIKRVYNQLPRFLRIPYLCGVSAPSEAKAMLRSIVDGQFGGYLRSWLGAESSRGMSRWRDLVDWVGGYPYETAKPEEVFDFFSQRGYTLKRIRCGNVGMGCNEFVFEKAR